MKKTKKIILIIILLLLIALAIFTGFKIHQYNEIFKLNQALIDKRDSLDFYYETPSANSPYKIYVKNNKVMHEVFSDEILTTTIYVDLEKDITYFVDNENKLYSIENSAVFKPGFTNLPNSLGLMHVASEGNIINKIKFLSYIKSITTEEVDGINTIRVDLEYFDENRKETTWFDANTLYPIKCESDEYGSVYYKITDCPLSEEDLTFTDIDNYTLLESENNNQIDLSK